MYQTGQFLPRDAMHKSGLCRHRHGRGSIFCNQTQLNPWLYRPNSTQPTQPNLM